MYGELPLFNHWIVAENMTSKLRDMCQKGIIKCDQRSPTWAHFFFCVVVIFMFLLFLEFSKSSFENHFPSFGVSKLVTPTIHVVWSSGFSDETSENWWIDVDCAWKTSIETSMFHHNSFLYKHKNHWICLLPGSHSIV